MKFDLTQLDPITREFVQSNPGGSAIQVSSRGQRLYYLAVVLLLLFLLKFRWDYFVFFVTGYLMIWYAAAVRVSCRSAVWTTTPRVCCC